MGSKSSSKPHESSFDPANMSGKFKAFSGKGCKLGSGPSRSVEHMEDGDSNSIECDGSGSDPEPAELEVGGESDAEFCASLGGLGGSQPRLRRSDAFIVADDGRHDALEKVRMFAKADFSKSMASHAKVIHEMIEVAEGWVLELPINKYSDDCRAAIPVFIASANMFKDEIKGLQRTPMDGIDLSELEANISHHRLEVAKQWQDLRADVNFVMGRASPRTRKLKREGSDVCDDTCKRNRKQQGA